MTNLQQPRAIETRDRILHGAAAAFSTNGYEGTTIDDILQESGVSKGSMYFHFRSKEELGRAILIHQTNIISGFFIDEGRSFAQQLVDASFQFGNALRSDALLRASVRMTTEGHGFDAEQREAFDSWLRLITKLCEAGLEKSEMNSVWSATEAARMLTACVNGIQLSSLVYSNYEDIEDRLITFWKVVGPGLFGPDVVERLNL